MGRILMSDGAGNGTTTVAALRNVTSSATEVTTHRSGGFNAILAVVVSALIIAFFVVGFASGYLRRWIWGYEDETRHTAELIRRRRLNALRRIHGTSSKAQRGLDPEIVAAIPLVRYKDLPEANQSETTGQFDCPVCLTSFDAPDTLKLLPICAHAFHSDCIDEWFRCHSTCPLCRLSFATKSSAKANKRPGAVDVDTGHGIDADNVIATPGLESHHELATAVAATSGDQGQVEGGDPRLMLRRDAGGFPSSFVPAIRVAVAPARAALTSMMRRSSSVGTDLHRAPHACYIVDSEATQHPRSFDALGGASVEAQVDGDGASATSSKACRRCSRTCAWCTRRSYPNLRQIEPFHVVQVT